MRRTLVAVAVPLLFFQAAVAQPGTVWKVRIGSWSGSPVVHQGKVLIGTNNSARRDPAVRDDCGVMLCFDEKTGDLLGQMTHARLGHRIHDMPGLGICCCPWVEEGRAYYVSNRGELVCLNLDAFTRPLQDPAAEKVHWRLDMVSELGVFRRSAGDIGNPVSSPIIIGDLVYCVTGNGSTFGYPKDDLPAGAAFVPKPDAPSFVAVNKMTGKVVWSSAAPGVNIQYGQWGSPAYAHVGGLDQVLFPGGDGWLYGFEAPTGRLLWKVDCNPPSASRWSAGKTGTRTAFMAAPVVRGNLAYIGAAVDLEIMHMPRPIYAVALTPQGDATRAAIKWTFHTKEFGGTSGQAAVGKDTLYALGDSGILVCLDLASGQELWRSDFGDPPQPFISPVVDAGKVYVAAGEKLLIFQDARQRMQIGEYAFGDEIMATPAVVNDGIFVATSYLYCIGQSR